MQKNAITFITYNGILLRTISCTLGYPVKTMLMYGGYIGEVFMVKNGERFYRESVERLAFLILTRFKLEGS